MPNKVIKLVKKGFVSNRDSPKREPIKFVNKPNGRPNPVVQKAGVTKTRRVFRYGS